MGDEIKIMGESSPNFNIPSMQ